MDSFENGTKKRNGVLNIIDLNGTWREMGRQYGALVSEELRDMYERAVRDKLYKEYLHDIYQTIFKCRQEILSSQMKDVFTGLENIRNKLTNSR